MAPSTDPSDYSSVRIPHVIAALPCPNLLQWCSLCNDFGELLILCAGCRVAVCSSSLESGASCLQWSHETKKDDFVYYCPFCTRSLKKIPLVCGSYNCGGSHVIFYPQLPLRVETPYRHSVYFRYDPPVLIIAATWHQTTHPFIDTFYNILCTSYFDSTDHVSMLPLPTSMY